jgi:hypothetical protein
MGTTENNKEGSLLCAEEGAMEKDEAGIGLRVSQSVMQWAEGALDGAQIRDEQREESVEEGAGASDHGDISRGGIDEMEDGTSSALLQRAMGSRSKKGDAGNLGAMAIRKNKGG